MSELKFSADVTGQPCSTNRIWRIAGPTRKGKRRKMYLTDAAAAWEASIVSDVRTQMDCGAVVDAWRNAPFPTTLAVTLTFYGVRGDIDNYTKSTLDGLKNALHIDDRDFSPVTARLGDKRERKTPGARIELVIPAQEPEPSTDAVVHTPVTPITPGSLRARDLVDMATLERLTGPAVTRVTIWPATDYGAIVVLFPPSQIAQRDTEWGTFLPLSQARQLRDALNRLPELQGTSPDPPDPPDPPDKPGKPEGVEVSQ